MPYYFVYREWPEHQAQLRSQFAFHELDAFALYDHLVDPELVQRWWVNRVCKLDLKTGGEYIFEGPTENWRLSGTYTKIIGGEILEFTLKLENDFDSSQSIRRINLMIGKDWFGQGCFVDSVMEPFSSTREEKWIKEDYGKYLRGIFNRLANYWHSFKQDA